jgi:hypothetical protein
MMAETAQPEENPAAAAFSAHVQAFYEGLPAEEKTLLGQVFALAASAAAGDQGDTQGFAIDSFLMVEQVRKLVISAGDPTNPLGA